MACRLENAVRRKEQKADDSLFSLLIPEQPAVDVKMIHAFGWNLGGFSFGLWH
jgi:hypothetical protein